MTVTGLDSQIEIVTLTIACKGRDAQSPGHGDRVIPPQPAQQRRGPGTPVIAVIG
jgi:hypothetical protein